MYICHMLEDKYDQCHSHTSFQRVAQKWHDGLNSNLHVHVTGPQGVPYFKVTLNSQ